jgi:hypothetical protein
MLAKNLLWRNDCRRQPVIVETGFKLTPAQLEA